VSSDEPEWSLEDITSIMLALMRSKLSWTNCSRRTMAKKRKIPPEAREKLEEVRREVRELIELLQAKLGPKQG
jgi:hypothetical protein